MIIKFLYKKWIIVIDNLFDEFSGLSFIIFNKD